MRLHEATSLECSCTIDRALPTRAAAGDTHLRYPYPRATSDGRKCPPLDTMRWLGGCNLATAEVLVIRGVELNYQPNRDQPSPYRASRGSIYLGVASCLFASRRAGRCVLPPAATPLRSDRQSGVSRHLLGAAPADAGDLAVSVGTCSRTPSRCGSPQGDPAALSDLGGSSTTPRRARGAAGRLSTIRSARCAPPAPFRSRVGSARSPCAGHPKGQHDRAARTPTRSRCPRDRPAAGFGSILGSPAGARPRPQRAARSILRLRAARDDQLTPAAQRHLALMGHWEPISRSATRTAIHLKLAASRSTPLALSRRDLHLQRLVATAPRMSLQVSTSSPPADGRAWPRHCQTRDPVRLRLFPARHRDTPTIPPILPAAGSTRPWVGPASTGDENPYDFRGYSCTLSPRCGQVEILGRSALRKIV